MKSIRIWMSGLVMMVIATGWAQNNNAQVNDSIAVTLKMRELNMRKQGLQQRIAAEDNKRNQMMGGVTPETQEMLNERQDSICLDLRSQLVAVELEIEERKPTKVEPQRDMNTLLDQINALRQNLQQNVAPQQPTNTAGKN